MNGHRRQAERDVESQLEQENDDQIALMESKARQLREISTGIRDEVRTHNAILDRVGASMGGAGDMLKASVSKFNKVFSSTENRIIAYVTAGCILAFVIFYFFVRSGHKS